MVDAQSTRTYPKTWGFDGYWRVGLTFGTAVIYTRSKSIQFHLRGSRISSQFYYYVYDLKNWTWLSQTSTSLCIWQTVTSHYEGLFKYKIWLLFLFSIISKESRTYCCSCTLILERHVHTLNRLTSIVPFQNAIIKMCVYNFLSWESEYSEGGGGKGWPLVTRVSSGSELAYPIEPSGRHAGI